MWSHRERIEVPNVGKIDPFVVLKRNLQLLIPTHRSDLSTARLNLPVKENGKQYPHMRRGAQAFPCDETILESSRHRAPAFLESSHIMIATVQISILYHTNTTTTLPPTHLSKYLLTSWVKRQSSLDFILVNTPKPS